MHKTWKFIILGLLLIFSVSCGLLTSTATPQAVSTPTPTDQPANPSATTGITETVPPTVEPPTATAPPQPTPTPAATSLNPTGPYVLFSGSSGIWIANPDGSFLTQVSDRQPVTGDLHQAVSPNGDRLAIVTRDEEGLELVLIRLPGGEVQTIARLTTITQAELVQNPTSARAFADYAISQYEPLAWQPGEGRLLAFSGAMDGPTSDLYLYDTLTGQITRMTDGLSQSIAPTWSPDGRYILQFGVSWAPPFGGAIVGYTRVDGLWAVRAADGAVFSRPRPNGIHSNLIGWQDDSHYLIFDSDEECYSTNLRSVNVESGAVTRLSEASFYYQIARSPVNGALLFAGAAGCPSSPGEGVFWLGAGQTNPVRLLDKRAYQVEWLPESGVFMAYPEALFSADGRTRYDPPVYDKSYQPAVSKNGYQAWEVIADRQGRVAVKVPGKDWQTIQNGLVADLIWDPLDGNTLLIALQDGSLYAAAYPDFSPRLMGDLGGRVEQAIWLP